MSNIPLYNEYSMSDTAILLDPDIDDAVAVNMLINILKRLPVAKGISLSSDSECNTLYTIGTTSGIIYEGGYNVIMELRRSHVSKKNIIEIITNWFEKSLTQNRKS